MGGDSLNLVDHNGSPVESSPAVDSVVEISSVEHSKKVAATTPKEVAPKSCKKTVASVFRGIHR